MDKIVIDGSLGATALSSLYWLELLHTGMGVVMFVGGLLLISLRIVISWREYKRGKQDG